MADGSETELIIGMMNSEYKPKQYHKFQPPTEVDGWRVLSQRARDCYWASRKNGASENEALSAAIDDLMRG